MKGIVFHSRSFSVNDGPGIRKAIFLKGCPLRCSWCHNPESQESGIEKMQCIQKLGSKAFSQNQSVGRLVHIDDLMEEIRADIPFFDESDGGVTLTGGEPLAQPKFSVALLQACKSEGVHTAIDTCGFAPRKVIEQTIPFTDIFLFDLKLADTIEHRAFTGEGNEVVLENLKILSSQKQNIIIRIPLVKNITDTPKNIDSLKKIVSKTSGVSRIDFLPYHSLARHKFSRQGKSYGLTEMEHYPVIKAQEIARSFAGLAPVVSVGG